MLKFFSDLINMIEYNLLQILLMQQLQQRVLQKQLKLLIVALFT